LIRRRKRWRDVLTCTSPRNCIRIKVRLKECRGLCNQKAVPSSRSTIGLSGPVISS
jgi:hypothetical protein